MKHRRQWLLLAASISTLVSSGCAIGPGLNGASVAAQSPNQGPFRTSTVEGQSEVMLEGHDAVAYFSANAAVRGQPTLSLQAFGVNWWFSSAENRAAFQREPQRYMPQFGGFCSNGINYAIAWGGGGSPNSWRIYRGKLYVFGGQGARDHFEMDTALNLQRAHHYWNTDIEGRPVLPKRLQRMVLRVPHYKRDQQLKAEWEARRAAGTLPVMPGGLQVVPATP